MSHDDLETTPKPAEMPTYWQNMSGFNYQSRVADRQAGGQRGYAQQEAFLHGLVTGLVGRSAHTLDLLEFGCGFGRHAGYLSNLAGARYYGYDFSEPMVAPLRQAAPPGLLPLEEHLFVGEDVAGAVGNRRFDLVFSVSVLIHNPPQRIPALLERMAKVLKPGGTLCLVENQVVPFSVFENTWHEGCWLHRYLDSIPPGWDLRLAHGVIDTHDIYVLRRNDQEQRRCFRIAAPEEAFDGGVPIAEAEIDRLGLVKLQSWARQAEVALRDGDAPSRDRHWDEEEGLRNERKGLERRRQLFSLADSLREVRAQHGRERLDPAPEEAALAPAEAILLDDPFDTRWSHVDARFNRVLHVFSQEWHGIRAASGYLPGRKLAITAARNVKTRELRRVLPPIESGMSRVVLVHGYSDNMADFVRILRKARGSEIRIFVAWHGSTAQFHSDFEIEAVHKLLGMRARGEIDGLAAVKPGMQLVSDRIHSRPLVNLGPRVDGAPRIPGARGAALVPMANIPLKNLYTNLYAALAESRLSKIYVTGTHRPLPESRSAGRLVAVNRLSRAELFAQTQEVDVSLHATLSECQPMTALEAIFLGVPCLTQRLAIPELDAHPYQQLVRVALADSVAEVHQALRRVLDERERDAAGLAATIADYAAQVRREALDRLGELLGL